MNKILLILILFSTVFTTACWETATEGTVKVQTVWDKITRVIKGGESVTTWSTMGDDYYELNLRSETNAIPVSASTKDNAALAIQINTTSSVINNGDEDIMNHMRKFGLNSKDRENRIKSILEGQVNTETKNVISLYDAYSLLANQEAIQKDLTARLKPIFAQQLNMVLESVQIIGRPDFLDDRIEQSASAVVANQKLKEAAEAALAASRVDAERKQVEAQAYANPNLLQIRKLELQVEVAKAWSSHSGTLIFGGNGTTQTVPVQ